MYVGTASDVNGPFLCGRNCVGDCAFFVVQVYSESGALLSGRVSVSVTQSNKCALSELSELKVDHI